MKRVIINADDFGINKTVTLETIRLLKDRKISSATIMANGLALDEVKYAVKDFPNASFGIHLCLSEFQSLTNSDVLRKYHIIDGDGAFIKRAIFRVSAFPEELLLAIKQELSAQIETLLDLDVPISHADSHHLVHTNIAPLCDCFSEVFNDYDIRKTRIGEEIKVFKVLYNNLIQKSKSKENAHASQSEENVTISSGGGYYDRLKKLYRASRKRHETNSIYRKQFITTDVYNSYNGFLADNARLSRNGSLELMCHPGHTNPEYMFEIENIELRKLDSLMEYELISYNDL